ncbi:MAG: UshA-like (seleno)protein [Polyangiaceae bacterium]
MDTNDLLSRRSKTLRGTLALSVPLGFAVGLAACEGCRPTPEARDPASSPDGGSAVVAAVPATPPTLRIHVVSDLAGALEPCGCVKDQLGGLDHAAAWIRSERGFAKNSLMVSAGPLFFMDPELEADKREQDVTKAKAIAKSLADLGFAAFAPGRNDWADGGATLRDLATVSGAALLAGNVVEGRGAAPFASTSLREIAGLKVGFVGVSAPDALATAKPVPDLRVTPAVDAVKSGVAELRKSGANVIVVLASVGRGEAKRIADAVPDVTAVVVGSPGGAGDTNTEAPLPERIGDVLILETGNHLQTVGVLDLHVDGDTKTFKDGNGLDAERKKQDLARRIREMRVRIAVWEQDGKIQKKDLDARRADVTRMESEAKALEANAPKVTGSFFRYSSKEIRTDLGKDPAVTAVMGEFYKRVNDDNRRAFASRVAPPPGKGEASYVGVDTCAKCHASAKVVWDKTAHAGAYKTLSDEFKEFNLDCVSCHVTGYGKRGGSTVTHVEGLKDVQCEVCHGPGSLHAKSGKKDAIVRKPGTDTCLSCHHPPHVHEFDADAKLEMILGPGHGRPL